MTDSTNTMTKFSMIWLEDTDMTTTENVFMMTSEDADKLDDFIIDEDYLWVIAELKLERSQAATLYNTKPFCNCFKNTYTTNEYCRCDKQFVESSDYSVMGYFSEIASNELKKSYNYITYEKALKETLELTDNIFDRIKERKESRIIYEALMKHRKINKDIHEEFEYAKYNPRTTIGKLEFDRRLIDDGLDGCFADE